MKYDNVIRKLIKEEAPYALREQEATWKEAARWRWFKAKSKGMPYFSETDPAWDDLDAAVDKAMKEEGRG